MRSITLLLLSVFLVVFSPAHAEKIRVVTRNVEPFSFEKDGRRVGYSMELWQEIAREAGLEYEIQTVGTAQEMIDALAEKRADAGVAALSVTSAREAVIDFTQPFYESGLQILVAGGDGSALSSIRQLLGGLFNLQLIGVFLLLLLTMFVISHLVWLYEHQENEDQWPKSYRHGMWESFWWTISTLLVGGADNKGPVGVGGRIVAIVWMLLSIVLVSFLTATFTTTLTVNTLKGEINGPGDLPGHTVATIGGSTSESLLKNKGVKVSAFPDLAGCVATLKAGKAQAVVYDSPILRYTLNQSQDSKLQLAGPVFENQNYAIALQQDSPLRERINRALLSVTERGLREELRKKWFGEDN